MSLTDIIDVALVSVDPALLSCWEEKVKQGIECSLLLKHKRGKITTTRQCSSTPSPAVAKPNFSPYSSLAEKEKGEKKKNGSGSKKRLEALLAYHQRLVTEKGLPPSKFMLKHASSV